MATDNTQSLANFVKSTKTTVVLLDQILDYYREQNSDLPKPRLKKEKVALIQACLAEDNYSHVKSFSVEGKKIILEALKKKATEITSEEGDAKEEKGEGPPRTYIKKNLKKYTAPRSKKKSESKAVSKDGAQTETELKNKKKTEKKPETKSKPYEKKEKGIDVVSTAILTVRQVSQNTPLKPKAVDLLSSPVSKQYDNTPTKYTHITKAVTDDQPANFAEISSGVFDQTHLQQAQVLYKLEDDPSFTKVAKRLPKFPLQLIFDITQIPVLFELHGEGKLHGQEDKIEKVARGKMSSITNGKWTLQHEFNEQWADYFTGIKIAYQQDSKLHLQDLKDQAVEYLARQFCSVFGQTTQAYYDLNQYPTFPVIRHSTPVVVKPDVAASHWVLLENVVFSRLLQDTPITSMLQKLHSSKLEWAPTVEDLLLPSIVVECKGDRENTDGVIKLLIEMAMIRDIEERLFKKPQTYTLGVYVSGWKWKFFALSSSSKQGYKYQAHHLFTHTLTPNFLSWLQLGVIMIRLAAYQASRLLKLQPVDDIPSLIDSIRADVTALRNAIHRSKAIEKANQLLPKPNDQREEKTEHEKKRQTKKRLASACHSDSSQPEDEDSDPDNKRRKTGPDSRFNSQTSKSSTNVVVSNNNNNNNNNTNSSRSIHKKRPIWADTDALKYQDIYSRVGVKVFSCIDEHTGEEYVIKELNQSKGDYEAALLTLLQGPGVVKLYHKRKENGKAQLWLEKLATLPNYDNEVDLKQFIEGLLWALHFVHSQFVIHGDIKHSNVMLVPGTNEVKLIDFGYSVQLMPGYTMRYTDGGTYAYMSPERLSHQKESNKIDIFSAGLVCAEKMYCTQIKSFASREELCERVFSGELSGLATTEGVKLLQWMLQSDPNKRPSAFDCLQHPYLGYDMDLSD